jgi:L-2-hydroxyglutarate oxidase LhgO
VIHAGLYYPAGSLKARLCREGRAELMRFADEKGIPYELCGKLVVALGEDEFPRLDELARRGEANGVVGLRDLDAAGLRKIEPHAAGKRALHVPETGAIDYAQVARALAGDVMERGGEVVLDSEVTAIDHRNGGRVVRTAAGEEIATARVVACAGLQADRVADLTGSASPDYRIAPFRGDFYTLSPQARSLVNGMIYPVPDPAFPFLGVHFTKRINGEVWAGPNAVPSLSREGYSRTSVNRRDARELLGHRGMWKLARRYSRTGAGEIWRDTVKPAAVKEMRRYLPELQAKDVFYARPGMRAQVLRRDGTLVDDFLIEHDDDVVHVVNAPSPAATASLAIGAWIASQVLDA